MSTNDFFGRLALKSIDFPSFEVFREIVSSSARLDE